MDILVILVALTARDPLEKVRSQILLLLHQFSAHFLGYGPISDHFSVYFFNFVGTHFLGFSKKWDPKCQHADLAI